MPGHIPCSVNMLTRNSAATLPAALASVSEFAEIVVGDGRSTDATRSIAAEYGCRIIEQDTRYTDDAGRLLNFAAARLQLIAASSYDWVLYLDSDELLGPATAGTIAQVLGAGAPPDVGAYSLQAKHVVNGVTIEDESKFGGKDPRLFLRSAVADFVGFADERLELRPGYRVQELDATFLKPLPPVRHLVLKWIRYLRVFAGEALAKGPEWTDQELPRRKSAIRWLLKGWRDARRRGHPSRMPFRYEAAQILLASGIYGTLRLVRLRQRLGRKQPTR